LNGQLQVDQRGLEFEGDLFVEGLLHGGAQVHLLLLCVSRRNLSACSDNIVTPFLEPFQCGKARQTPRRFAKPVPHSCGCLVRSEERREGKRVDRGGRRIIKKKIGSIRRDVDLINRIVEMTGIRDIVKVECTTYVYIVA